jgi:hypothetical protein
LTCFMSLARNAFSAFARGTLILGQQSLETFREYDESERTTFDTAGPWCKIVIQGSTVRHLCRFGGAARVLQRKKTAPVEAESVT